MEFDRAAVALRRRPHSIEISEMKPSYYEIISPSL
jgi:hypothetical protein